MTTTYENASASDDREFAAARRDLETAIAGVTVTSVTELAIRAALSARGLQVRSVALGQYGDRVAVGCVVGSRIWELEGRPPSARGLSAVPLRLRVYSPQGRDQVVVQPDWVGRD